MLQPEESHQDRTRTRDAEQDIDALLAVLPPHIFQAVRRSERTHELLEIVMDLGREPEARFLNAEECSAANRFLLTMSNMSSHVLAFLARTIGPVSSGRYIVFRPFATGPD